MADVLLLLLAAGLTALPQAPHDSGTPVARHYPTFDLSVVCDMRVAMRSTEASHSDGSASKVCAAYVAEQPRPGPQGTVQHGLCLGNRSGVGCSACPTPPGSV